ncbi:MAG: PD-(D/E)XK nuclease family protein [Candidatus Thermoplasmatota archaeon]|jgi:CRISPR-associated exonuclease Cas4|nr:PD-(D/E)XK nuclease family protein [Candidatus Sysuiplasma jiujiangense]MCL4317367.1 PD-(D/E)XK nuclease family protein [Candidatus Thermoplasmatota archaeon]MBX8640374.1 PD-(D/E)XK nuclease family protein [Candidatus Sysuiplasma jiujiangense]MBX8642138.1 PD-(D/E)XK nuclease family protein [Candidatus Sysuiplasma jiujiangense]MCL5254103.1 PD-(D/E)XK nuclease family protein [Candidatus Thermoplasmatota archaeon]
MAGITFSAGDIEKFSYCPLSWWLSRDEKSESAQTASGSRAHKLLNDRLTDISSNQKESTVYSRMIMYYAVISTVLAIAGLSVVRFDLKYELSRVLLLLSIIWIIMAVTILYISRNDTHDRKRQTERIVLFLAALSMVLSILSVTILQVNTFLAMVLESASLLWLIGASSFLYLDLWAERKAENIEKKINVSGRIIYIGDDRHPVLVSGDGTISGRPDFIIESEGEIMPVEFKSGRRPAGPLFSHIMQVSAYCRLVEDNFVRRPDYGLIYYGTKSFAVDFDDEVEKLLMKKVGEMRIAVEKGEAHRNHNRPGKCLSCSRRAVCDERLA